MESDWKTQVERMASHTPCIDDDPHAFSHQIDVRHELRRTSGRGSTIDVREVHSEWIECRRCGRRWGDHVVPEV